MTRDESAATAGGAVEKRSIDEFESDKSSPKPKSKGGRGGRVIPQYYDRIEPYAYVTKNDLHEAVKFGILEHVLVLVQMGTFFFSGAFWELVDLIIHATQSQSPFRFTPWMGVCILSFFFGAALWIIGWVVFSMKQSKLRNYFPSNSATSTA